MSSTFPENLVEIEKSKRELQTKEHQVTHQFYIRKYNHGQNCWDTFHTILQNSPPRPLNNVET